MKKSLFLKITTASLALSFSVTGQALSGETLGPSTNSERNLAEGWRPEFNPLARTLQNKQDQSYAFLISFAPQKTISYRNGTSLKNSLIALRKNDAGSIGHTLVAWQCSNGRSVTSRGITGFSGERSKQVPKMRQDGYGMLGLLAVFTDGYIQNASSSALNYKFSQVRKGEFQMKWLGVKVSNQACQNMLNFQSKFKSSGASRNFGFNLDAAKYEGAGCSSYARQVLAEAGVLTSTSQNWFRQITVPYALMANPRTGLPRDTKFKFSIDNLSPEPMSEKEMLFRNWSFNQQGIPLRFADTELVYYTVAAVERILKSENSKKWNSKIRTSRYRYVRENERGQSLNTKVDRNMDQNTQGIYNNLRNNRLDTYDYTTSTIGGVTGVILEGGLK
jgi:hypothetical protein